MKTMRISTRGFAERIVLALLDSHGVTEHCLYCGHVRGNTRPVGQVANRPRVARRQSELG
jgi:hypothetical protein